MNILVVAAHPDDEVLGAGGAILHHVSQRDKVAVLILGEGITSRYQDRTQAPVVEIEELRQRSLKALGYLGVHHVIHKDFPDNRFDSVDFIAIVKEIERIKKKFRPSIVYTHHLGDLNIDHRLTAKAVVTATRPLKTETVSRVLSFEVPSSTEWSFSGKESFSPNVFLNISSLLRQKLKAFGMYGAEVMHSSHPRSLRGIQTLAELRGLQSGYHAAEAFCLIREGIH